MRDTIVSDTFAHLLQPDTLLPSQYFAALRRKGQHEPERRLAIAVLQDAVDCYQKHPELIPPEHQEQFEKTLAWKKRSDTAKRAARKRRKS